MFFEAADTLAPDRVWPTCFRLSMPKGEQDIGKMIGPMTLRS